MTPSNHGVTMHALSFPQAQGVKWTGSAGQCFPCREPACLSPGGGPVILRSAHTLGAVLSFRPDRETLILQVKTGGHNHSHRDRLSDCSDRAVAPRCWFSVGDRFPRHWGEAVLPSVAAVGWILSWEGSAQHQTEGFSHRISLATPITSAGVFEQSTGSRESRTESGQS